MQIFVNSVHFLLILWASSIWADDPIQIEATTTAVMRGPLGCPLKSSLSTMNVRIYSLKTSSGLVFKRKTLDVDMFACFKAEGNQNLTATNFKDCAEATVATGLQMFRWENNQCTGYSMGIPKGMNCKKNEAVVLYSVDAKNISVNTDYKLTLHHGLSSNWAEWRQPCFPEYRPTAAKFQLRWNGKIIALNGSTFAYKLKEVDLCQDNLSMVDDALKNVTLEVFDDTDTPMMEAVTQTLAGPIMPGRRYLLTTGNCLYYDNVNTVSFEVEDSFCRETLFANLFIEYKDGDFETYKMALNSLPQGSVLKNFVGLINDGGQWTWLSGFPYNTSKNNELWMSSPNPDMRCVAVILASSGTGLASTTCQGVDLDSSCHEYLP